MDPEPLQIISDHTPRKPATNTLVDAMMNEEPIVSETVPFLSLGDIARIVSKADISVTTTTNGQVHIIKTPLCRALVGYVRATFPGYAANHASVMKLINRQNNGRFKQIRVRNVNLVAISKEIWTEALNEM